MRKSVLISIQPKWVKLIASGKKTIELRTTRPKEELPFKCYIYCTKAQYEMDYCYIRNFGSPMIVGKDIERGNAFDTTCNGYVVGEFWCDTIDEYTEEDLFKGLDEVSNSFVEEASCVDLDSVLSYKGNKKVLYGWHIKGLMIYSNPRPLSDFGVPNNEAVQNCEYRSQCYSENYCTNGYIKCGFVCSYKDDWCTKCKRTPLTRAPQSWGYAEEIEKDVP